MTDRERVARALMARASPGTAWGDVSGATREHFLGLADAALAAMAPTWLPIPAEVVEWSAARKEILTYRGQGVSSEQYSRLAAAEVALQELADATPLPAPPAGEVG